MNVKTKFNINDSVTFYNIDLEDHVKGIIGQISISQDNLIRYTIVDSKKREWTIKENDFRAKIAIVSNKEVVEDKQSKMSDEEIAKKLQGSFELFLKDCKIADMLCIDVQLLFGPGVWNITNDENKILKEDMGMSTLPTMKISKTNTKIL